MVLTPVLAPIITLGIVMVTVGDIIFKMITCNSLKNLRLP